MSKQNPPDVRTTSDVHAQTLPLQGAVNRMVRGLLHMPLLSRLVGKRLLTVQVVGRKSGRRYEIPVAYARHDGALLISTQFAWARNLRTGEPVEICIAGKRRTAGVEVLIDEADVVEHLALLARDNQPFAKFNKIGLDQRGEPLPEDLRVAWAAGPESSC